MQIVINISKETYKSVMDGTYCGSLYEELKNGVPIPECHGKLVDIDLLRDQVSHDEREAFSKHQVWLLLSVHNKNIPTILDADEAYKNRNRVIGVDLNHAEVESDIEKRKEWPHKPCINYEDGCEEWTGCPCVYYKAESEE